MPPVPVVPDALRDDFFIGAGAVDAGHLTRAQLRGSSWQRLFHDVYVHRDVPVTHELRARAAATLLAGAVVTGCSAAVLWGVPAAETYADVEVTRRPGSHMVRVEGIVMAVDQLIATGVVDLQPIRDLAASARGPGSARARQVADLADGLAESPQETRLGLLIGRSALPAPMAQYSVRVDGRFLARVDFAWTDRKVAVEYDGLWHADAGRFVKDRQRLNRLQAAGWRIVFVTAADLHRPVELVARIAAALVG